MKHLLHIITLIAMCHLPAAAQTAIVTMTTYHAVSSECSGDPLTTADGTKIIPRHVKSGRQRIVAVSRDLLQKFPYGTRIHIEGHGTYTVADTMHRRFTKRIDILIPHGQKGTRKTGVKIKRVR